MSNDKKDAMPPFPVVFDTQGGRIVNGDDYGFDHDAAAIAILSERAIAWEARCRKLHEAASTIVHLHDMYCESHVGVSQHSHDLESVASKALAAIGPLPELPPLPPERT